MSVIDMETLTSFYVGSVTTSSRRRSSKALLSIADGICDALFAIPTRKNMNKKLQRLISFGFLSFSLFAFLSPLLFISFSLEGKIRKLMFKLSIPFDLSTLSLFWILLTVKNCGSCQDRPTLVWTISAMFFKLEKMYNISGGARPSVFQTLCRCYRDKHVRHER